MSSQYALITGANRGIGREIVRTFASNGINIIANCRTSGALEELGEEIKSEHGVAFEAVYFDVSKADEVKGAFLKIRKISKQLDIVVNNAGILDNNLLGMVSQKSIEDIFGTNTFGTIYVMQYASRLMLPRKRGSIINISSIVGVNGNAGQIVYSGSKAAIVGITRSAAKELAPYNIRVNAIAPGFIDTDMITSLAEDKYQERVESIKMKRIGTPRDIANCALFLASDQSEYITGQIIGVDGCMMI